MMSKKGLSLSLSLSSSTIDNTNNVLKIAHRMASEDYSKPVQEIKIYIDESDHFDVFTPNKDCDLKATDNFTTDNVRVDELHKQPQVWFNYSKGKKRKSQKLKLRNYKRNDNFKNRDNKLAKKMQRYYSDKCSTVARIQKDLYEDCTTEVASRCKVVKNALARENLLKAEYQEVDNQISHIISLTSTPSTERTLNNSLTSQKTLKSKSINSSNNDMSFMEQQVNSTIDNDTLDVETRNDQKHDYSKSENSNSNSIDAISVHSKPSIIEVTSDKQFSYQSNIVHVAMAATEMSQRRKVSDEIKEYLHDRSMTSVAKFDTPSTELTLRESSSNFIEPSNATLVNTASMKKSSNTTLTLLRNESLSNDSSYSYVLSSNSTIKQNEDYLASDALPNHVKTFPCRLESGTLKKMPCQVIDKESTILSYQNHQKDKMLSKHTTNNANDAKKVYKDAHNVFVTKTKQPKVIVENVLSRSCRLRRSKGFLPKKKKYLNANVKRYQNSYFPNIPYAGSLKAMIEKVKTIEDIANVSDEHRTEIWEKVTIVLDVIAQRLEHSLADKIIKEIRTQSNLQHVNHEPKPFGTDPKAYPTNYSNIKVENSSYSHKSFQCSIVDNEMLDNMMLKLSMDGPKIIVQPRAESPRMKKIEHPVLYKDIEILKSPAVKKPLTEKIITVDESSLTTTSTLAADVRMEKTLFLQRLKCALMVPVEFVSQNSVVIVAIPLFFVFMFLMYTVIAILASLL